MSQVRRYRITHRTHFVYSSQSSLCHNQAHLRPRDIDNQSVASSHIEITPKPAQQNHWVDAFGNQVEFFSIEELHDSLTVISTSTVDRTANELRSMEAVTWAQVRDWISNTRTRESSDATQYLFDSRYCQSMPEFAEFAMSEFSEDVEFMEAILRLNNKVFQEFRYSPNATQVTTSPIDALRKRMGVCQDFAHVLISCFRSLGLPSRYVSGYLLTKPPEGKPKLIGADASHAWVSVFAGPRGWIDLDPTNNVVPGMEHITVAWGRDYSDVAPIHGVYVGGGFTALRVSVDVAQVDDEMR